MGVINQLFANELGHHPQLNPIISYFMGKITHQVFQRPKKSLLFGQDLWKGILLARQARGKIVCFLLVKNSEQR